MLRRRQNGRLQVPRDPQTFRLRKSAVNFQPPRLSWHGTNFDALGGPSKVTPEGQKTQSHQHAINQLCRPGMVTYAVDERSSSIATRPTATGNAELLDKCVSKLCAQGGLSRVKLDFPVEVEHYEAASQAFASEKSDLTTRKIQ